MAVLGWIGLFFFFAIMLLAIFSIIFGLPGTWIILAEAALYGLITKFDKGIGGWDLLLLLAMAAAGELGEFLLTAYGAKKYGASKKAIVAAIIGGLLGAILLNMVLPVLGAVLGAFLGVYLAAFLVTWYFEKDQAQARRAAAGAFMGRVGAVLAKGTMAAAMAAVIASQIL